MAPQVNRDDRTRARGNPAGHILRIQAIAARLHVGEDGNSSHHENGGGGRNESVGRHDHFIPGPDSQGFQGDFDGHAPV